MKFTYLLIDLSSVMIPLIFSFHSKIRFYEKFKAFFAANAVSAICFISWDVAFTAKGIWGFNEQYVIGLHFLNLPVEEVLFFFCIPFACLFTYHCFMIFRKRPGGKHFTGIFICILFIAGIFFWEKTYTTATFISTALLLFVCSYILNIDWAGQLYRVYAFLLIPFFVVNGILTGTGLTEPIVWYNNNETMSFRILTIPFEDVFFGFELIFMTTFFYELFQKLLDRKKQKVPVERFVTIKQ
jgi:lycopene cyclase domain-containing protein